MINRSRLVEIVTSVDPDGEWDKGQHVFRRECILSWGDSSQEEATIDELIACWEKAKERV